MPKKIKFSVADEEYIINFVKTNEILYNIKHKMFRDTERKNRLWMQLADELDMEVGVVKKKWTTMRDYFVRSKKKKTISSEPSVLCKRDELLSFLLKLSVSKRSSIASLPSISTLLDSETIFPDLNPEQEPLDNFTKTEIRSYRESSEYSEHSYSLNVNDETSINKKLNSMINKNDILYKYLKEQSEPCESIPKIPTDDIKLFFDSMALTVRKFSPLSIARIKLNIAQIVGEEEIAWAEQNARNTGNSCSQN